MWRIENKKISMDKGDFGLPLPMTISNILEDDVVKFEIYDTDEKPIIQKNLLYREGKYVFELSKEESDKLVERNYMYKIVQYRNNIMQNTINKDSLFEVV